MGSSDEEYSAVTFIEPHWCVSLWVSADLLPKVLWLMGEPLHKRLGNCRDEGAVSSWNAPPDAMVKIGFIMVVERKN